MHHNSHIKRLKQFRNLRSIKLDNYEVVTTEEGTPLKQLGCGGYGFVYQVKEKATGKICAMKECQPSAVETLLREAHSMQMLHHPNIVDFIGFTKSNKSFYYNSNKTEEHGYICMEYCKYGSLKEFVSDHFPTMLIPVESIEFMFGQIVKGRLHMVKNKLCHRDMKPDNILVMEYNEQTQFVWLKLCDFGLSRSVASNMVKGVGTLATINPIILSGKAYDDTVDIFSLGCILYYLLYKQYPHQQIVDEFNKEHSNKKPTISEYVQLSKELVADEVHYPSDVKYQPYQQIISFIQQTLLVDSHHMNWETFEKHPFVEKCLQIVSERDKQQLLLSYEKCDYENY